VQRSGQLSLCRDVSVVWFAVNADTIDARNISTSKRSTDNGDEVFIRWSDPPSPNGLIVLYDIELVKADVANVSQHSISLSLCLSVCQCSVCVQVTRAVRLRR